MKNPNDNFIELRINKDFGGILSTYFEFIRKNLKSFTNIFINYNGLFLIGLLIASYFLVSGSIGLFNSEFLEFNVDQSLTEHYISIGIGSVLFLIILIIVGVLNYGLSASYMIQYQDLKGATIENKTVWDFFKKNLSNTVLFILMLIVVMIGFVIVSLIMAIIPILGSFAQLILQFFIMAWAGVSYFVLLNEKKSITDALGEGWNLVYKNFWVAVGVNFILGILNNLLIFVLMIVPSIIIGVYTYHVVENDVNVMVEIIPKIVYTLGLCFLLIILVFAQCLSQFINGILYYSFHEKMYNEHLQNKIDQIGNLE